MISKNIRLLIIITFSAFLTVKAQLPSQSCHDDLFVKQAANKFWGYVDMFDEWRVEAVFTKVYPFTGNKAVVEKYGQYGVANCTGKLIIPAEYEEVGPLTFSQSFWAKRGGKWSLVNEKGELTAPGHVIAIKEVGFNSESTWLQMQDENFGLYDKRTSRFLAAPRYSMFQILSEKASIVQVKEKFGVVSNNDGKYLFEPVITSIKKLTQQVIIFQEKGKWGILNPNGEVKKVAEMDSIGFIMNNLFYASKNGKAGLIDAQGKDVLALEYEEVNPFYDHMSLIKKNGNYGFTTLGGRISVPLMYEWGDKFQNGQSIVKTNAGYFIVDKENKKVTQQTYKWMVKTPSRNYYAANRDGKYLFLDLSAKEIMKPTFGLVVATDTSEFVRIQDDSTKLWSYFDLNKNKYSFDGANYDEAGLFKYNYAFVKKGLNWGVINEKGEFVVQPSFEKIDYLYNNQIVYFLVSKGDKKGLLSSNGTLILSANYDMISATNSYLKVKENGKYKILKITGEEAIKTKYDFISNSVEMPFTPEWPAIIQKKKDFGLLAQNLTELVEPDYENISFLGDNLYLTVKKEKKGIINSAGKIIAGNFLDEIKPQSEKYLPCKQNGKWGYLFNTGKMMIQPTYSEAGDFYKNLAVVKLDGKYGVINKQGKMLLKNEFESVQYLPNNKRKLVSSVRTIEITDKGIIKQME